MSIAEIIDRMNFEADASLAIRRQLAGVHRHGIWRGQPNPYTVGYVGRSDAWDW